MSVDRLACDEAVSAAQSMAERAYGNLARHQRDRLLREVFQILEYDECGRPGAEWSSDTAQALGDAFVRSGVVLTNCDEGETPLD